MTAPDPCRAPLASLLEQVQQMRGLFPDDDGAISRAIRDAELALFGETDEPTPEDTDR